MHKYIIDFMECLEDALKGGHQKYYSVIGPIEHNIWLVIGISAKALFYLMKFSDTPSLIVVVHLR